MDGALYMYSMYSIVYMYALYMYSVYVVHIHNTHCAYMVDCNVTMPNLVDAENNRFPTYKFNVLLTLYKITSHSLFYAVNI